MPADMGLYDKAARRYENGLVDDELGALITKIRSRGANVWAIFDACNSGSATRGEGQQKGIDPAALGHDGLPFTPGGTTRGAARTGFLAPDPAPAIGRGTFVGFYAVDPFNLAYEQAFKFAGYELPLAPAPPGKDRMSVFTHALHKRLQVGQAGNFEELFQDVLTEIASDPATSARPRPVADGDLARQIPGADGGGGGPIAFFENGFFSIQAGAFHGFDKGAGLAIYQADTPADVIATADVIDATPVTSVAGHVKWRDEAKARDGKTLRARVERPVTALSYRVALPANLASLPVAARSRIKGIFDLAFAGEEPAKLAIGIALADDIEASLLSEADDQAIWLLQRGQPLIKDDNAFGRAIGITLDRPDDVIAAELRDSVWKLSRADRLVRAAANSMPKNGKPKTLAFRTGRFRSGLDPGDPRAPCGRDTNPRTGAPVALSDDEEDELEAPAGNVIAVGNCDIVSVDAANLSFGEKYQYYVGAFYVDALGAITAVPPVKRSGRKLDDDAVFRCAYSLPPQQEQKLSFQIQVGTWNAEKGRPSTTGLERLVLIAIRENAQRIPPNLCALQQTSAAPIRIATRGGAYPELDTLLGGITGQGDTREAVRAAEATAPMESFFVELDVRP